MANMDHAVSMLWYFCFSHGGYGWNIYWLGYYLGLSILKIRTFLEHRADESVKGRSVIIEDKGILAWLFLNNNFHALHHDQPELPWYALPRQYQNNRQAILTDNKHYCYRSYGEVFRQYFFKRKDPVVHPINQ